MEGKDEPKISVLLSVLRNDFLNLQLDEQNKSKNLLQVSSTDKTSLFCLNHKSPTEMKYFNNTLGLMNMESFVDLHLDKVLSRTQPVMWDQVLKSPSSSLLLHLKYEDWSGKEFQDRLAEQTMRNESHIRPLWRTYSLTDLHMLEQIYKLMNSKGASGDLSTITISESLISSVFKGQTIFSLFDHSKD